MANSRRPGLSSSPLLRDCIYQTWRSPVSPTILITMREYFLLVVILQVPTFNFTKRLRIWGWNIFYRDGEVDQYDFSHCTFWFERRSRFRILPFNLEKEFSFHPCTGNFNINAIVVSYVPWFIVPSSDLSFPQQSTACVRAPSQFTLSQLWCSCQHQTRENSQSKPWLTTPS